MIEEPKRVMSRARRAIDVAMMAAGTMADLTAVDKTVIAAREGRSAARREGGRRPETGTASRAAWARRASWRAWACGPAHRAARSAAACCARAPPTAARCALAAPLPLGASANARSVTPAHSNLSRAEGN